MADKSSNRMVRLWDDEINAYQMKVLIQDLSKLVNEDPKAPISFEIYSGGGICEAGFAFCDWVSANNIPLNTVAYGQVSSMAVPIFLLGGHRSIGSNCTMTLHPMASTFAEKNRLGGSALAQEISKLEDWQSVYLDHILRHVPELSRKKLKKMMDRSTTLKAHKALKMGFAHEILGGK